MFNRGDYSIGEFGLLSFDISNESRKKNGQPKYYFHIKFTEVLIQHICGVIKPTLNLIGHDKRSSPESQNDEAKGKMEFHDSSQSGR